MRSRVFDEILPAKQVKVVACSNSHYAIFIRFTLHWHNNIPRHATGISTYVSGGKTVLDNNVEENITYGITGGGSWQFP